MSNATAAVPTTAPTTAVASTPVECWPLALMLGAATTVSLTCCAAGASPSRMLRRVVGTTENVFASRNTTESYLPSLTSVIVMFSVYGELAVNVYVAVSSLV